MKTETMYEAFINRDATYEGLFYAAVKTTGIFCRPTCNARKAKKENIEFFSTSSAALSNGYTPCKVCNPLGVQNETWKKIEQLLAMVHGNPAGNHSDKALQQQGIAPSAARRWFLKHYGVTFQEYRKMLRINAATTRLNAGDSVTGTAFSSGFNSLSGFQGSYKAVTGTNPGLAKTLRVVSIRRLQTPLGEVIAGAVPEGICLLAFTDKKAPATQLEFLERRLTAKLLPGDSPHITQLDQELLNYFKGVLKKFTVRLLFSGTQFEQKCWDALTRIPFGSTISYSEQAADAGYAKAMRAVGRANARNLIMIIVPCHRVVGKNGSLTGYAGGLWRKKWLIQHEKQHSLQLC